MLGLPGVASAFQNVTIETGPGGTKTLHIVGDVTKKPDTVTITYDSVKDEYVITHDIVFVPAGCTTVGPGPPYKEVHCPQKGINYILIETGTANDIVKTTNIRLTTVLNFVNPNIALFFPPDLIGMDIKTGADNDKVVDTPAPPAPGGALHPAVVTIDMGGGNDSATLPGGGNNTFIFGDGAGVLSSGDGDNTVTMGNGNGKVTLGNGNNSLTFGIGNSNVMLGGGTNSIVVGDGNTKVTVGNGANTAQFGAGKGVFTGGEGADVALFGVGNGTFTGNGGDDRAIFGAGNNRFFGGAGSDLAKMGAGNDEFSGGGGNDKAKLGAGDDVGGGGGGNDKLFGGPGGDWLLGGPGGDWLFGGPGLDHCNGGPGKEQVFSCEIGAHY
jgi:Ca2+-binding RTX toxin-like protein